VLSPRSAVFRALTEVLIVALLFSLLPVGTKASVDRVEDRLWLTKTAFGELLAHTGTDPQPYAFAGEPFDPNSGFQYHRARWMDPGTGRLLGMDLFPGGEFEPASLHKYLYASGNPANSVDPTGLFSLPEISLSLVIRSVVQTLAISAPLRAFHAAQQLKAGADLGAVAQEFAIGIATDVALSVVLSGVFQYAPRLFQARAAGQALSRAAESPWNLDKWARGLEIERRILGGPGRFVKTNEAVIDDFTEGVATSIKSIDLTLPSYQSAGGIISEVSQHARNLATYTFNLATQVPPSAVKERVLVVAIERGAATAAQQQALTSALRNARNVWPNIRLAIVEIP
jgi:RHS repeat-associated protein